MDYAYYNNQAQAAFHGQQFNDYTSAGLQYAPVSEAQEGQQFNPAYQIQSNGSYVPSKAEQQSPPPRYASDPSTTPKANGRHSNGEYTSETQEQDEVRSSDEEKESLTPAQSRRKAQNRAAQRAFRERKERHVKELENKLHSLSTHSSALLSDNERLKRELQRLATQNEILRATSSSGSGGAAIRPPSPVHGPQTFSPIDFQDAVGEGQYPLSFEDFGGPYGQRLLAVGAAWDLIMNHEAYKRGQVDMELVQRKLRGHTHCDGRGPAFKEQDVLRAIEESATGVGDGLL
ncbi:MAG: hypothetical protein GOMPHAMPRED_001125 [Gomphillus americanus]|uniref:BZIP domain-containing protein n=1 Tax=Gomphillus americanus TaxID=1940652 RepID=A0A8H3F4F8_9LECA|nr:MAG: hypothetical protein GOMPHAMPRED_001125 [Gomphillus americanus]